MTPPTYPTSARRDARQPVPLLDRRVGLLPTWLPRRTIVRLLRSGPLAVAPGRADTGREWSRRASDHGMRLAPPPRARHPDQAGKPYRRATRAVPRVDRDRVDDRWLHSSRFGTAREASSARPARSCFLGVASRDPVPRHAARPLGPPAMPLPGRASPTPMAARRPVARRIAPRAFLDGSLGYG